VTDDTWYDFLKILAVFMVGAGYKGMLVMIDELVNLYKIPHSITRQNNYEKILTIYNDVLQGKAQHIGFLLGGTPQCVEDKYRGLYSYEALRSRLAEGHFAGAVTLSGAGTQTERPQLTERQTVTQTRLAGVAAEAANPAAGKGLREVVLRDLSAPIIRLEMLTQEEMYVLVEKLMYIHADYYGYKPFFTHEDLLYFLTVEYNRVGADTHITPREIIRDFIELANIIHQNPGVNLQEILGANSYELTRASGKESSGLSEPSKPEVFQFAKGGMSDSQIHDDFVNFEL
jgi:hypothetical protein